MGRNSEKETPRILLQEIFLSGKLVVVSKLIKADYLQEL